MLGYKESAKVTHLLGIHVGICNSGEMNNTGLFFVVEDESKFILEKKKPGQKEKLSVPNFDIALFKECASRI